MFELNDIMAMHDKVIMTVRMSSWLLWFGWSRVLGWPGTSHSVDICEGLEDWTTDLSNISDSDEEDDVLLVSYIYIVINIQVHRFSIIWDGFTVSMIYCDFYDGLILVL